MCLIVYLSISVTHNITKEGLEWSSQEIWGGNLEAMRVIETEPCHAFKGLFGGFGTRGREIRSAN
jgi:hypothetical protein